MSSKAVMPIVSEQGWEELAQEARQLSLAYATRRGEQMFPSHQEIKDACESVGKKTWPKSESWAMFYAAQLRSLLLRRFRMEARERIPAGIQ